MATDPGAMPSAGGLSGKVPTLGPGNGGDSSGGQAQLPDHAIVALLQREHLLMLAGLHLLHLRIASVAEIIGCVTRHLEEVSIAWHQHCPA